jgi:hypothetical protein
MAMIFPAVLNPIDAAALIVGLIIIILAVALTAWVLWVLEERAR